MKKFFSVVMLLLTFSSNFFYYSFADDIENNVEEIQTESEISEYNDALEENQDDENFIENDIQSTQEIVDEEYSFVDNVDINLLSDTNDEYEEIADEYSCESCEICYDINQEPDEEFCGFCFLECDDGGTESWGDSDDDSWEDERGDDGRGEEDEEIVLPNLIISEVFFDGTKEWIEVYNAGDNFEGYIDLNINTKDIEIDDFEIGAGEIVVIANNSVDFISNIQLQIFEKNISITDTKEINIVIYSEDFDTIDSFHVDESDVKSVDKKKNISFHRFMDTKEIVETKKEYSINVLNGYLANPGMIFNGPTIPETPEIQTAPNLKITEIYFDGDDNWFEITNIGNADFSGDLILSGNLDFGIQTEIKKGISKVFSNDLSMFQTGKNIELIDNEISFENEEINLDLIRMGYKLDNFYVHKSRVNKEQNSKSSFEKVGHDNKWMTTFVGLNLDRRYNVNRGYTANPTKYFTIGENMKDVTKPVEPMIIPDIPINCEEFWENSTVNISEIYFGSGIYPPYIELRIIDEISDYYPQIFLSGSAIATPVYFMTKNLRKNTFTLLTDSYTRYNEGRDALQNKKFALNNSGWIVLYGKNRQNENVILDVVYLGEGISGISNYAGKNMAECASIFDYQDTFSPGMNIGQSQFIQITPDPIIQYVSINNGGNCSSDEKITFNTSESMSQEIQISAIKYYQDKQILKLKNKTNSDIDLRDYSIQTIDGNIQKVQGNTLFAKSTISFLGNYGLSTNSDFCVNLLKGDIVVDRYCRNSLTKATAQDEENIKNQLTFREDLQDEEGEDEEIIETGNKIEDIIPIKIINIDYDPAGADGENESITLRLLTGGQVDLSKYTIQYTKDGKTTQTKKIQGILSYGNSQVFKGAFSFPNSTTDKKQVLVELLDSEKNIVDTYIYNPNKITEIPAGDYDVISVIDGDTIKISYADQEFTVRLAGIDAPESSSLRCGKIECFGPEAKSYLTSLLAGKTISFVPEKMDDYDRFVGYIFLDGENINEKIIKNGYAREYSYKNQSYKYQSQFKSAQDYARNHSLGLRGNQCKGERFCPVEETQIKDSYIFNIENVIYDPEGDDNGNEEIWITMIEGFPTEFGSDFYLLVNDTKKSLKKYGSINPGETKKIVGTFGFPNTKMTTISFVYDGDVLDTYSYDPDVDKESTMSTGDEILSGIRQLSILSVLPNPFGADGSGEELSLYYDGIFPELNFSSGFYLQIGTTKKYLKGSIPLDEEITIKGAFSLPNKGSCIEIGYNGFVFDKFCYEQPAEGQKFYISNGIIESLNTLDLTILKNSKLQNIGNKVCLTYGNQKFYCKNMPYSKLSTKKLNQNGLYKEFFDSFESYLKENWKIMYYDSEIKNYFDLLNDIEKAISNGQSTFELNGTTYNTSEFQSMYDSKYKKTAIQTLGQKIQSLFPKEFEKYKQLKIEYESFLSKSN